MSFSPDTKKLHVRILESCKPENETKLTEEIKSALNKFQGLKNVAIDIVFDKSLYLSTYCVRSETRSSSYGTATLVTIENFCVGITAKHVISSKNQEKPKEIEVHHIPNHDPISEKFCLDANSVPFGVSNQNAFAPNEIDVAVIFPSIHITKVNSIPSAGPIFCRELNFYPEVPKKIEDPENVNGNPYHNAPIEENIFLWQNLLNKRVLKYGVSSQLTRGKIVSVNDEQIEIESVCVGPFAVPGDSGSLLIYDDEDNFKNLDLKKGYVIGILNSIMYKPMGESVKINFFAVPIWPLSWLFEEVCPSM